MNLLKDQAMTVVELARESFSSEEEILDVLGTIDGLSFFECEFGKLYYLEKDNE